MKKMIVLLLTIVAALPALAQSNTCNCPENFSFTVQKIEANYSGIAQKITPENQKQYDKYTRSFSRKAKKAQTPEACAGVIKEWLSYFKDHHIYLVADKKEQEKKAVNASKYATLRLLDANTTLITLPSFMVEYRRSIDSVTAVYTSHPTPNLILDIRGNGGGSDASYRKLRQLIYTKPVILHSAELRASEDNITYFERLLDLDLPAATKETVKELVAKMKANKGGFALIGDERTMTFTEPEVLPLPKRVAVLQDQKCASSAEQFILYALQSDKTTTFGTYSGGVLDYANVNDIPLPSIPYTLNYATSRSTRLPAQVIDNVGIAPQVPLQEKGQDAIKAVHEYLKQKTQVQ